MFCSRCGAQVDGSSRFCAQCGAEVNAQPAAPQDYVPYQAPVQASDAPLYVQQPDSPLRPALRHPFFYICAIVYLFISCLQAYGDLQNIYLRELTPLWFFSNMLPALLYVSTTLLIIIGLILHFATGLKKNGPISEAGFTLMRVALIILLVNSIYAVFSKALNLEVYRAYGRALYSYSVADLVSSLLLSIPFNVIVAIFAIKANQTALAMAKGKDTTLSAGLSVMLFVRVGILLIQEVITRSVLKDAHVQVAFNYLLSIFFTNLPSIFFAILLLVIPQKKK